MTSKVLATTSDVEGKIKPKALSQCIETKGEHLQNTVELPLSRAGHRYGQLRRRLG